jgi:hypothetical protein
MYDCMNCDQPDPCKSCGGCRACGCGSCCDECTPRTRRFIDNKLDICSDTMATCFPPTCCTFSYAADISKLQAWVRPRGTSTWQLTYTAFDRDDMGRVCFRWDNKIFELGKARLEVEFRETLTPSPSYTYKVCGVMELRITDTCVISLHNGVNVSYVEPPPPATNTPSGVTDVFDTLIGFKGTLCSILEPSAIYLSLCPSDVEALCAAMLCRPAQLQVSDGVNVEYVYFSGCIEGLAYVVRGEVPRRFPVGSQVTFTWTPDNITAATEGCP